MTKRLHPIRKMEQALWEADYNKWDRTIARHVKPLLDALEAVCTEVEPEHRYCDEVCKVRVGLRLLAAWKEPL